MTVPLPIYEESLESLVRIQLSPLLVLIGQAREGHPGAQSYDTPRTSGHTTVKFCERHQRDNCPCGQSTTYPSVSDPTGELATRLVELHDVGRRDLADAHKAMRLVSQAAQILERLHRAYTPHEYDGQALSAENIEPGCRSCARLKIHMNDGKALPRWEPIYRDGLCRWCYDWRRKVGGHPAPKLLQQHHDGKRVMVPVVKNKAG